MQDKQIMNWNETHRMGVLKLQLSEKFGNSFMYRKRMAKLKHQFKYKFSLIQKLQRKFVRSIHQFNEFWSF